MFFGSAFRAASRSHTLGRVLKRIPKEFTPMRTIRRVDAEGAHRKIKIVLLSRSLSLSLSLSKRAMHELLLNSTTVSAFVKLDPVTTRMPLSSLVPSPRREKCGYDEKCRYLPLLARNLSRAEGWPRRIVIRPSCAFAFLSKIVRVKKVSRHSGGCTQVFRFPRNARASYRVSFEYLSNNGSWRTIKLEYLRLLSNNCKGNFFLITQRIYITDDSLYNIYEIYDSWYFW